MLYLGSKNRISKELSPVIQSFINDKCGAYIEPFVGGGNMIDKIHHPVKIGSDIDKYVIAVLNGLKDGIYPPEYVSKELYEDVKNHKEQYSDFIVGYIGYELSFGAKWFAGYVKRDDKKHRGDIYSYKSCVRQMPDLKNITFVNCDFRTYSNVKNCVIYCDPPYKDATSFKNKFQYEDFYDWCRELSKDNTVLISEYNMPNDFECIWKKETKVTLDSNKSSGNESDKRVEKLFKYRY